MEGNEHLFLELITFLIDPGVTCHDESLETSALTEVGNLLLAISLNLVLTSIEVLEFGQAWEGLEVGEGISGNAQSLKASQATQVSQSSQSVAVEVEFEELGHCSQTSAVG